MNVSQILTYRGPYFSRTHLPSPAAIDALDDKMPYAFVPLDTATLFPGVGTLGAQQTARSYFSAPDGCWVLALMGSSSQAAGFVLQIYDTGRQALWHKQPILFANGLGSAGQPLFLKKPYRLTENSQIQCRVTNLAAAANAIQIVCWGVRD